MAKMGNFDFSEFKKFRDNLKEMHKAFPGFMRECVIELANRLLAKVVPRTPADTGELRRSWTIGQVVITDAGAEIEVFNPVYYSAYIEYGHRTANHKGWVEGRFMMKISNQELKRELPVIMKRKMDQFITRYLGR
ncbi:HK97 gp10 family phage protein [Paenibacillus oralis]|uniref:HK97 gp10 family phage protein n=1 Tax=Paenibacillus oralis TaxID=2490856 RepID=A0A3P3TXG7_9BACL|nr:HK97 gp10 family phage protein [Paenibacillus oralis]RRJ62406.1 HK97 gp10 family phage protein [Paenibacillus oralis]